MNWVRACAILAAVGVHAAVLAFFIVASASRPDLSALQSGSGNDDLSVVATITMQSEESIGFDQVSAERQDASAAGQMMAPPLQEEDKKPDAVSEPEKAPAKDTVLLMKPPPDQALEPAPPIEEKKLEKRAIKPEFQPSNPGVSSEAQDEQRAASRELEARHSQLLSRYNGAIYETLLRHTFRPKTAQKGRVVVALTLAASGDVLAHDIVESSGSELLDKAALISLERAAPFPPLPAELSKVPYTLRVPFEYAVK